MNNSTQRNAIITYWVDDISQQDCLQSWLLTGYLRNICIGAIESTSNDEINFSEYSEKKSKHFHVYVEFTKPVHFKNIKDISNTSHIEKRNTTRLNCIKYCLKEGEYYNTFTENIETNNDDDISSLIFDDIEAGEHLWLVIRKFPKFCLYRIKEIVKVYEIYENFKITKK